MHLTKSDQKVEISNDYPRRKRAHSNSESEPEAGLVFSDGHSSDSDGVASCLPHGTRPNINQANVSTHPASSTSANLDPFDAPEFLRNQAGSSTSNENKNFDSLLMELSHFYPLEDETGPDIVDAFASIITQELSTNDCEIAQV